MGMPPIYRLKHWLADKFEDKPRPEGELRCATCRGDVPEGAGEWDAYDRVVLCGPTCIADWATDRAY